MPAQTVIKVRRDTAANWASTDPVLAAGEHGYETDTGKFKIGDGTTAWVTLAYATDWANVTEKPTLGTAASKDVAATGDASSTQVVLGNDTRLTDSRTPTAHATSHESGGTDEIEIAPAQITASSTSGQVLSSNGTTTVWSDPAGGLPTQTGNAGELLVTNGTAASWSNTVTANSASVPAIIAKGTTSQTGSIQQWQDSSGTILARMNNDVFYTGGGSTNFAALYTSGQIRTVLNDATKVALEITAAPSQTANIQEWKNSGGTALASINSTGLLTATPAEPDTNANTASRVGYIGMPQVLKNTSGTLTLQKAWAGEHIFITAASAIINIPANSSVPFEIGTTIVIVNANVTSSITITNDTLRLAGTTTIGNRTLAPYGMATLLKIDSTTWIASGNGLT